MTLVGKILTMLIFVMSVVFMAFTLATYATHRNWRDVVQGPNGLNTQLQTKQRELDESRRQVEETRDKLALEKAARREALGVLEVKALDLRTKLLETEEKYRSLVAERQTATQTVLTAQTEMTRLKDEVDALRKDLQAAREDRNAKLTRVTELTDKLNQGEGELRRLKERNDQMLEQLGRAKLVMDRNGLNEFTPVVDRPPSLDGVVTSIGENQLVEVSLGADEGLRTGHHLDVYRGDGSYIGRLVVVDANADRAVGRIVPEYRQGVIRRGDRVATKLL